MTGLGLSMELLHSTGRVSSNEAERACPDDINIGVLPASAFFKLIFHNVDFPFLQAAAQRRSQHTGGCCGSCSAA